MIDLIFDLLPDEPGEYIGCAMVGGAAYLYFDYLDSKNSNEKSKAEEMKEKIQELSKTVSKNCLSPEALKFIKSQRKD